MSPPVLTADDAKRLRECIAAGGVAVFPADTVYGLACDPLNTEAVTRLYELKGRPAERPAAVMFFSLAAALEALPELASTVLDLREYEAGGRWRIVRAGPAGRAEVEHALGA